MQNARIQRLRLGRGNMQALAARDIFLFTNFRLDRRSGGLFRRGKDGVEVLVVLGSRALDILALLLDRRGDLVTKDEIIAAVWQGVVVEDSNLTVHIAALRRILDEGRVQGSCIQTVVGRGYRFVAEVVRLDAEGASGASAIGSPVYSFVLATNGRESFPARRESSALLPLPDKPSIVVLPFQNMSSDPEQEFLADGIVDDVITALSRYSSLFVIARNSSFTYKGRTIEIKQVARELGVRYVLEGSLRKSGNRIRVSAQLVDAETAKHVWADRWDRELADLFAVQDEISEAAATAIAPAIAGAERRRAVRKQPGNLDAWAAYQRGLWHLGKANAEDNAIASEFFQRAIDLDSNFAGGYCGLATAQLRSAVTFATHDLGEMLRSAEALARRAVTLDDSDAEVRACLARVLWVRGDHWGAQTEAEQALAISPNLASAHAELGAALVFSGRRSNGIAALEKSIRLDPRDPRSATRLNQMAIGAYLSGDYVAAVTIARRAIQSYPEYPLCYR